MAVFTYKTETNKVAWADTTVTTSAFATVVGDLVVVILSNSEGTKWGTGIADKASNGYTLLDVVTQDGNSSTLIGYTIATNADAANTVTGTMSAATNGHICVVVFTIDGAIAYDTTATGQSGSNDATWTTGELNTGATDTCLVAGFHTGTGDRTFSDEEIPTGSAATAIVLTSVRQCVFYQILASQTDGVEAEVTPDSGAGYSGRLVCFKSSAVAGTIIPKLMNYYQRLRA